MFRGKFRTDYPSDASHPAGSSYHYHIPADIGCSRSAQHGDIYRGRGVRRQVNPDTALNVLCALAAWIALVVLWAAQ